MLALNSNKEFQVKSTVKWGFKAYLQTMLVLSLICPVLFADHFKLTKADLTPDFLIGVFVHILGFPPKQGNQV